jgi:hypothetical protein
MEVDYLETNSKQTLLLTNQYKIEHLPFEILKLFSIVLYLFYFLFIIILYFFTKEFERIS